jgi:microcystin-dependent protein
MARMQFVRTAAVADVADGDLDAVANVQVDVFNRGTVVRATVYTTETEGTAFPNPYTTTISGLVSFWATFGKYDVRFTDLAGSPRFTTFTIGWDSTPYDDLHNTLPTGAIQPMALRQVPDGWLLCDGSAVSRSTYATLWDALRTDGSGTLTGSSPYGNGDGSTTFNVPDLRGRTPIGVDGAAGLIAANDAIGNAGGAATHLLAGLESGVNGNGTTGNDTPAHTHETRSWASNATVDPGSTFALLTIFEFLVSGPPHQNHTHPLVSRNADNAHNNMQPYRVVNYMIKA